MNLKYEIPENGNKIDRLEYGVSNNCFNKTAVENNCSECELFHDFPLKTLEELNIFEKKLLENSFRLKMVSIYYLLSDFF